MEQYRGLRPPVRTVVALLLALAFCTAQWSCVSSKPRVLRIGMHSGLDFFANTLDGFKAKMTQLGYIEGSNVLYDVRNVNSDIAASDKILRGFVQDKVDMIVVCPTDVSLLAKKLTAGTGIVVVFANANIEGSDLVASVKEPGANITGVRYPGPDLAVKRCEMLLEIAPHVKRVIIPYKRTIHIVAAQLAAIRAATAPVGVSVLEWPVADLEGLKDSLPQLESVVRDKTDGILMIAEPLTVTPDAFIVLDTFARKHHLPVGGSLMLVDDHQSLFGATTNNLAVGAQAAEMADKVFKGAHAGSLPVISAETTIQINLKAAHDRGYQIPEGLLKQADRIVQ